ncbi:hypothetical protein J3D55_001503 [Chryseobacterium ginsenosidimutans]|uniref:hypothetical protein n=1 Tax=Chryseobacterium ginsenosidimutans TaxID=687846 RepID=UPI002166F145|nr:hypothetical protein [Chryseobacterium ginsenosidimutans]MCS3868587.1 hypothetical protein [Chryseobacterium ginsenosidimutans]
MIVHFILSGETLESISEEINLENPQYLKEFHNTHCAREDLISDQLIPRRKLLIPDLNKIKEYNSKNDAPFKNPRLNPEIPFNPENFSKIYSVINTEITENELEKRSNILSYTVSVKWIKKEGSFHIFHLFKNNFSDEHGSMMADLASQSIRSLHPIEVKTDDKGEIVSVTLTQETISNFGKIKERLYDLFSDKYAKIYLEEFEFAVLDKDLFNDRMKEDVFIKTYFASLRNKFTNGKSYFTQTIGEENIPIVIHQKVENPEYDEEIVLQQNIIFPEKDKSFTGKYTLYIETGMVKEFEIQYNISQFGAKNSSFFIVKELS